MTVRFDAPSVSITTRAGDVAEGDSGASPVALDIRLSEPAPIAVTVRYQTRNGSAAAGSDYEAIPATEVTIPCGGQAKQVYVNVKGDYDNEPQEFFHIDLDRPTNAVIGQGTATIAIGLDDNPFQDVVVFRVATPEGSQNLWYAQNNGRRTVRVTIVKTVTENLTRISESAKTYDLKAGQKLTLGGDRWTLPGGPTQYVEYTKQQDAAYVGAAGTTTQAPSNPTAVTLLDPIRAVALGGNPTGSITLTAAAGDERVASAGNTSVPSRTASNDTDGDGVADVVSITGPGVPLRVSILSGADGTVLVAPFDPFGGNFTGGGYVAAGDLDGDGRAEFAVTPDQGGGPRVTVFTLNPDGSTTVRHNFLGIDDANFRGGARAAIGDVNGDGTPDLIVAAGFGGGPRVAVFEGKSVLAGAPVRLVSDFFAFPGTDATNLRNGAFVAAGDIDGDGFAELVFGGGPGGAPRGFILSGALVSAGKVDEAQADPVANFFAGGNPDDRGGARVAVTNSDGDGRADLAVGSGAGRPAKVRVYLGKNFGGGGEPPALELEPFGGGVLADGVYVG